MRGGRLAVLVALLRWAGAIGAPTALCFGQLFWLQMLVHIRFGNEMRCNRCCEK